MKTTQRDRRALMGISLNPMARSWAGKCFRCRERRGMYHDCPLWEKGDLPNNGIVLVLKGYEVIEKDGDFLLEELKNDLTKK